MPRRARLAVPGIAWHIIQRGNNRTACFFAEQDYSYYLSTLAEQATKFDCQSRQCGADDEACGPALYPCGPGW